MLLFGLADKEDKPFQPAAAPWHARFVLAAELIRESELVMNLLCGIRGGNLQVIRRRLLEGVECAGLSIQEIR